MGNKRENDFYTISRENYLIATYLLQKKNGQVRSVDIAEMLGYSKPSVSNGIHLLIENGLLLMNENHSLQFTEQGKRKAEEIYKRYQIVKDYLRLILKVSEETAEKDSRRIEHPLQSNGLCAVAFFENGGYTQLTNTKGEAYETK